MDKTREKYDVVQFAKDNEYREFRVIPEFDVAMFICQMVFTWRLIICETKTGDFNMVANYCYETALGALRGMNEYNPQIHPEPTGWHRHIESGRRRPGGDATQEYVNR